MSSTLITITILLGINIVLLAIIIGMSFRLQRIEQIVEEGWRIPTLTENHIDK